MFKVLTVADLKAHYKDEPTVTGPIVVDRTPVRVCGDPLTQIWWQGKQWAVTKFGIECRAGRGGHAYTDAHGLRPKNE